MDHRQLFDDGWVDDDGRADADDWVIIIDQADYDNQVIIIDWAEDNHPSSVTIHV